jgi:hypothetical protein
LMTPTPGGRVNWIAWVAVLLAVIIAIAYGLGVFH